MGSGINKRGRSIFNRAPEASAPYRRTDSLHDDPVQKRGRNLPSFIGVFDTKVDPFSCFVIPGYVDLQTAIEVVNREEAVKNRGMDRAATLLGRLEKELAEFKKAVVNVRLQGD